MRDRSAFWLIVALCIAGAALVLMVEMALAATVEVRYDHESETAGYIAYLEAALAACPANDAEAATESALEHVRGLHAYSVTISGTDTFCVGDFLVLRQPQAVSDNRTILRGEDAFFLLRRQDGARIDDLCHVPPSYGWLYVPLTIGTRLYYVYDGQMGVSR